MKNKMIILFVLLTSSLAIAGGTGAGGGVKPEMNFATGSKEIVFHMGEKNGQIDFAYGQLREGNWQIEKHNLPKLELDRDVIEALKDSKIKGQWKPILNKN